jgi:hypothetical protein
MRSPVGEIMTPNGVKVLKEKISNNNNNTPVIIGAIGTISKSFRQYLSNMLGKNEIKELQKTAVFDTAHIFWKALK